MSLVYRAMYRIGFTPWDTGTVPPELTELTELVEGGRASAPGRALDIGCGTGTQSVYLARHGWDTTGIDDLERPLRRARDRAAAAGVTVDWRRADATRLADAGLRPGFNLLLDRGCFHGLSDEQRRRYARGVGELAAAGAVLLLMAFARNRVPAGPSGADRDELERTFAQGWALESALPNAGPPPPGPMGKVPLTWYRLERT
jgi:cyclopropane fatty-acyl-phospholipid synthase-like methyltransferase